MNRRTINCLLAALAKVGFTCPVPRARSREFRPPRTTRRTGLPGSASYSVPTAANAPASVNRLWGERAFSARPDGEKTGVRVEFVRALVTSNRVVVIV